MDTHGNDPEFNLVLDDCIFVIFGITGDLVRRKLLPALYQLANADMLPMHFKILGTTRRDTQVGDILSTIRLDLDDKGELVDEATLERLAAMITMVPMDIGKEADYAILKSAIQAAEQGAGQLLNRLFYLAVPPKLFQDIIFSLKAHGLHEKNDASGESRLLIEKPFGHNTQSAVELIRSIGQVFDERSIYRVDHYLAKETAQNILTFRFNNPLFKAAWDNNSIDHIMITASESIGIEGRVAFYEQTGALRDLIQSHLLQLLALTTMEEPRDRSAAAIHEAKLALLNAIEPIKQSSVASSTVRGQYKSYKSEVDNESSSVETYAAIRLAINNHRWRGVPVLLRTGKALREKITEITLIFKDSGNESEDINALTIRIQPNEGIVLSLLAKKPSLYNENQMVQMKFFYGQSFADKQTDAYARVLIDAIRGDKTLFTTDQEVLASWNIIEHVLNVWSTTEQPLEVYENGSWGPLSANALAQSAGASWSTAYSPPK